MRRGQKEYQEQNLSSRKEFNRYCSPTSHGDQPTAPLSKVVVVIAILAMRNGVIVSQLKPWKDPEGRRIPHGHCPRTIGPAHYAKPKGKEEREKTNLSFTTTRLFFFFRRISLCPTFKSIIRNIGAVQYQKRGVPRTIVRVISRGRRLLAIIIYYNLFLLSAPTPTLWEQWGIHSKQGGMGKKERSPKRGERNEVDRHS